MLKPDDGSKKNFISFGPGELMLPLVIELRRSLFEVLNWITLKDFAEAARATWGANNFITRESCIVSVTKAVTLARQMESSSFKSRILQADFPRRNVNNLIN